MTYKIGKLERRSICVKLREIRAAPKKYLADQLDITLTYNSARSCHPEVFLGKGVLKICSKFTGEHPSHFGMGAFL